VPACADPSPALDRVSVWLGGYYANTDVSLTANSNSYGVGTGRLKLSDDDITLPRARLDFLIGDSQGLSFDYYRFSRDRTQTLSEPFNLGGYGFDVNANVKGKFDLDLGSAAYRWWLGSGNDVFGIGLGAAYYRVKAGISGEISADGQTASAELKYDDDAVAPLVTLGWRHAFSDDLRVYLDASGVKKNGGNLSGHIVNAALGVEWFPWHNVGVGAEYATTRIKLDQDKRAYAANLDIKLNGPAAYLRMRF
jgi:hypothetical protein